MSLKAGSETYFCVRNQNINLLKSYPMKFLLLTTALCLSLFSLAQTDKGQYKMIGYVYTNDSVPLTNAELTIKMGDKISQITTDGNGQFETFIDWSTIGKPIEIKNEAMNIVVEDPENEKLNPSIEVIYNEKSIEIPNMWKFEQSKEASERGGVKIFNFRY
jgi:hypothetical protein